METEIKNKVVVIPGGSGGIGSAIADEFLKQNADTVIIVDINDTQGTQTVRTLNSKYGDKKSVFIKGDVTSDLNKIYDEIIEKYKYVDILVNSAGVADETSFRRTISINTVATVEWSMKFYEKMRKDKGGKGGTILNICSIFGYIISPVVPYYTTSKYAVMGFTRALGHTQTYELTGVRVIALCPGVTRTDLGKNCKIQALDILEEFLISFAATSPRQEPEDVAKAATELIKNAKSGSAWNIINAEPIQEVL